MIVSFRSFLIHKRPQLEKHEWLTFLTEDNGIISCLCLRSSKRCLQMFQPTQIHGRYKGQKFRLSGTEPCGFLPPLSPDATWAGLYLNELIFKLCPQEHPVNDIFLFYENALRQLCQTQGIQEPIRFFEHQLQTALGYGLSFDCLEHSKEDLFFFDKEEGLLPYTQCKTPALTRPIARITLEKLQQQQWQHKDVQTIGKHLFSHALEQLLGEKSLFIKKILPHSLT